MTQPSATRGVKEEVLLPCPRCQGRACLYESPVDFEVQWSVRCDDCNIDFDCCLETEAEAIAAWNTRTATPSASVEKVARAIAERMERSHDGYDLARAAIAALAACEGPNMDAVMRSAAFAATEHKYDVAACEGEGCPICANRPTSFTRAAASFCDKHYRQYLATFQTYPRTKEALDKVRAAALPASPLDGGEG